jgi:tRNA 2-thiocytidine biosynthesis protein TtcA
VSHRSRVSDVGQSGSRTARPSLPAERTPQLGENLLSEGGHAGDRRTCGGACRGRPARLTRLEQHLAGKVGRAITEYDMLGDGDEILVGVSGGADSFLMLKLLAAGPRRVRCTYKLTAAHIRASAACTDPSLHPGFTQLVEALGVPFIERRAADRDQPRGSPCFRCAWLRRKALFEVAHELSIRRIALGHHADDFVETALMNMLWHGRFASMEPVVSMMDGTFLLLRPMIYVGKDAINRWRRAQPHDFFSSSCRSGGARDLVRSIIHQVSRKNRAVRKNLLRCVLEGGVRRMSKAS